MYDVTHPHGLDTISGYSVVLTDWTHGLGERLERIELERIDGATNYGRALTLVNETRAVCTDTQYAVIDTLHVCGCRSDDVTSSLIGLGLS